MPTVLKSGNLNLLETSGPVQACTGIALPFLHIDTDIFVTAVGLIPSGSSTVLVYTQTLHRTTQLTTLIGRLSGIRTQSGRTNWEECGPCPVFASYTLAFALQLRKKHGKTSVRVAEE